jgi:hypothetical protein
MKHGAYMEPSISEPFYTSCPTVTLLKRSSNFFSPSCIESFYQNVDIIGRQRGKSFMVLGNSSSVVHSAGGRSDTTISKILVHPDRHWQIVASSSCLASTSHWGWLFSSQQCHNRDSTNSDLLTTSFAHVPCEHPRNNSA